MTASYREYAWTEHYRTEMNVRPVYDSANRVRTGVRHEITIDGYITDLVDDTAEDVYRELMEPGGELILDDHGYSSTPFHVNGTSAVRDMEWGPHPQSATLKPLGGDGNAIRAKFTIVTVIPWCDGISQYDGVAEICYSVTHEIDASGMTVERHTGHIIRALTRRNADDRNVPHTVDEFREKLATRKPLPGFSRTQSYTISEDRRKLEWTWIDTELPTAYPMKVTKITCRQRVYPSRVWFAHLWNMDLTATITMARGVPQSESFKTFLLILADRARGLALGDAGIKATDAELMRTHISIDHDVFGLETTYRASVRYIPQFALSAILLKTKMWQPFAPSKEGPSTHERWTASLEPYNTFNVRGGAKLKVDPDVLVDICEQQGADRTLRPAKPPEAIRVYPPPAAPPAPQKPTPPKPEASWLVYYNWFRWLEDSSIAVHKPLPAEPVQPAPQPLPQGLTSALRPFPQDASGNVNASASVPALRPFPEQKTISGKGGAAFNEGRSSLFKPDIVQKAASATRYLVMEGYGCRVGRRVPVPKVLNVGGSAVVEVARDVREGVVGDTDDSGVIMCTAWRITYLIPQAPAAPLPVPKNPTVGGGGGDSGSDPLATASPGFVGD